MIQKIALSLKLGLVGWSRVTSLHPRSLKKLAGFFYPLLCTLSAHTLPLVLVF